MNLFRGLRESLRSADVGCTGALVLVFLTALGIFGLVLMAWWPYMWNGK
jgi:hypothetical protein